ncbi:sunset domain-containing protein [Nostocoides jenkinsii]|uniref:Uncharacterized protein n=1 Tax=Nostocoides jenkinsii Ben 74 TaxID=1193518 RepID=A0A077MBW5_9MICO|nr:hypothetical protein [Tetrasphaera jenkinsii]CCI54104.1 exported hypothetical protein [Tetrasphaera jenkinsii Ben 74]
MSGRNVVLLLIFLAFLGLVWWLIKSSRRSSQPSVMHSDPIDPAAYRPASVDLSSAGSAPVAGAAGVGMAAGAAPEYQAGAGMPLADPIPAAGAREGDWDDPTVGDGVAAQAAAAESSSGEPAGGEWWQRDEAREGLSTKTESWAAPEPPSYEAPSVGEVASTGAWATEPATTGEVEMGKNDDGTSWRDRLTGHHDGESLIEKGKEFFFGEDDAARRDADVDAVAAGDLGDGESVVVADDAARVVDESAVAEASVDEASADEGGRLGDVAAGAAGAGAGAAAAGTYWASRNVSDDETPADLAELSETLENRPEVSHDDVVAEVVSTGDAGADGGADAGADGGAAGEVGADGGADAGADGGAAGEVGADAGADGGADADADGAPFVVADPDGEPADRADSIPVALNVDSGDAGADGGADGGAAGEVGADGGADAGAAYADGGVAPMVEDADVALTWDGVEGTSQDPTAEIIETVPAEAAAVEPIGDAGADGGADSGADGGALGDAGADGGADAGADGLAAGEVGADGGADAGADGGAAGEVGADGGADAGAAYADGGVAPMVEDADVALTWDGVEGTSQDPTAEIIETVPAEAAAVEPIGDAGADGGADSGADGGADAGADGGAVGEVGADGGADSGADRGASGEVGADGGADAGAAYADGEVAPMVEEADVALVWDGVEGTAQDPNAGIASPAADAATDDGSSDDSAGSDAPAYVAAGGAAAIGYAAASSADSGEGDPLGDDLPAAPAADLEAGAEVYGESEDAGQSAWDAPGMSGDATGHEHAVVDGGWSVGSAAPNEDGCMPLGHPIKGVFAYGMVYQVPGSDWYDATEADVWFTDEDAAQRAGFHRGEG